MENRCLYCFPFNPLPTLTTVLSSELPTTAWTIAIVSHLTVLLTSCSNYPRVCHCQSTKYRFQYVTSAPPAFSGSLLP